jgi:hypothetical protein
MIQVTFKKWGIWQQKSIPFDCFKEAMFFKAKEMGEVLYYLEGLKIDTYSTKQITFHVNHL